MENKKGFAGLFLSMIIAIVLICGCYILWYQMSMQSLENTTKEAAQDAGVKIDAQDALPQGQVDAVRDMVGKVQDKKNTEMEDALKKEL